MGAQNQAPIWHPCTVHQACTWGQALAAFSTGKAVHAAMRSQLGVRAERLDLGQAGDSASSATAWQGSWEAFVGLTKDQLVAWASDDVAPVRLPVMLPETACTGVAATGN